jgi:hypothetical protein
MHQIGAEKSTVLVFPRSTPILINFFTDGLLLCGAPATTPWHYDAVEERPSTPSATAVMSPSRWPKSPSPKPVRRRLAVDRGTAARRTTSVGRRVSRVRAKAKGEVCLDEIKTGCFRRSARHRVAPSGFLVSRQRIRLPGTPGKR